MQALIENSKRCRQMVQVLAPKSSEPSKIMRVDLEQILTFN